jgi:hypothetical protein
LTGARSSSPRLLICIPGKFVMCSSTGLLKCHHGVAAGSPQSKWLKRRCFYGLMMFFSKPVFVFIPYY